MNAHRNIHLAPHTPKFSDSTFADAAPTVAPTPGLPAPFLNSYDEDGACLFDFVEAKFAEIGSPSDYNHLYIWDGAIKAFPDMDPVLASKIQANAHPANHPFGAPLWQCSRFDAKLPDGNWKPNGILPYTLSCIYNLSLDAFKAIIASQTAENYYRTPYAVATTQPRPLGT